MSTSKEWREIRDAILPRRKAGARRELARAGIDVIGETEFSLYVKVNCATIEYFPFTGGFRGKGIPPGSRGLRNLIALKKGH